jgi:hypothetical protein
VVRDGKILVCSNTGQWVVLGRGGAAPGAYTGGGVYTQAP